MSEDEGGYSLPCSRFLGGALRVASVWVNYQSTIGKLSVVYRSTIAIAFTLCFALCYKVFDVS